MKISIDIPDTLAKDIKSFLKKEDMNIKKFTELAIIEKYSSMVTEIHLRKQKKISDKRFFEILNSAEDRPPLKGDELI